MKKFLLLVVVLSGILMGCNQGTSEDEFVSFSSDFYTQMMTDGEQTEQSEKMYEEYVNDYKDFDQDDLHIELVNMYKALGDDGGSATDHQLTAMKLLNDR